MSKMKKNIIRKIKNKENKKNKKKLVFIGEYERYGEIERLIVFKI